MFWTHIRHLFFFFSFKVYNPKHLFTAMLSFRNHLGCPWITNNPSMFYEYEICLGCSYWLALIFDFIRTQSLDRKLFDFQHRVTLHGLVIKEEGSNFNPIFHLIFLLFSQQPNKILHSFNDVELTYIYVYILFLRSVTGNTVSQGSRNSLENQLFLMKKTKSMPWWDAKKFGLTDTHPSLLRMKWIQILQIIY